MNGVNIVHNGVLRLTLLPEQGGEYILCTRSCSPRKATPVLQDHEINKQRIAQGSSPANVVLLRGCGSR